MDWPTVIYGMAIATNAAFTNIAPTFYRAIDHWSLPIQCPLGAEELKRFAFRVPERSYTIELKSGWFLGLESGVLIGFESPTVHNRRLRPNPADKTPSLAQGGPGHRHQPCGPAGSARQRNLGAGEPGNRKAQNAGPPLL